MDATWAANIISNHHSVAKTGRQHRKKKKSKRWKEECELRGTKPYRNVQELLTAHSIGPRAFLSDRAACTSRSHPKWEYGHDNGMRFAVMDYPIEDNSWRDVRLFDSGIGARYQAIAYINDFQARRHGFLSHPEQRPHRRISRPINMSAIRP